jgi:transcriptional regulator with AAA-type ATPase domain
MKKKNIYISINILIPAIYTGISIIGVIITYQLFKQHEKIIQISSLNFVYLITAMAFFTFFISFLLLHFFLKPLIGFVNKTQNISIIANSQLGKQKKITDDYDQITKLFDSVANILSNVEAKELFPNIIGSSASMRNIFTQIIKVAPTDSTVLISGESGTGKELIAAGL